MRRRRFRQRWVRLVSSIVAERRTQSRPDAPFCGVDMRAGSLVLIPFWLLHRNPKFWPAPDMFDPGRFLTGAKPDRFVYLPFGVGPHICIGAQLAMTEAVLVLARLVQCFVIMRTGDRPVGAVKARPHPLVRT